MVVPQVMDGLRTYLRPDRDQDKAEHAGFPDMNPDDPKDEDAGKPQA